MIGTSATRTIPTSTPIPYPSNVAPHDYEYHHDHPYHHNDHRKRRKKLTAKIVAADKVRATNGELVPTVSTTAPPSDPFRGRTAAAFHSIDAAPATACAQRRNIQANTMPTFMFVRSGNDVRMAVTTSANTWKRQNSSTQNLVNK